MSFLRALAASAAHPLILGGMLLWPTAILAQATPSAPTREEIERPVAPPAAPRSRLVIEGGIERAPCALADPAYADVKVTIRDATFASLGPVSPALIRPAYERFIGQPQPVSVLCEIRDGAATILRRQGYLAAVQVPTQRIEDGTVRFEVLYARLTAVRVRGDVGNAEALLSTYLNKLTAEPLFNRFQAERYLLLVRDLPGYEVRLALRPAGTAPGDLVGDVTVSRTPVEADLNIQNMAGPDTGRFGGQLRAQFFGLAGQGDRATVALYSTADFEEQQVLQLGYDMKLGGEGLTIGGRFTSAWTEPAVPAGTKIVARTYFTTFEASYPFVRSQQVNIRGALGIDILNQRVRFNGMPLTRDRLRVAYLRVDGDSIDTSSGVPQWRFGGSAEIRKGLGILDASDGCGGIQAGCRGIRPSRLDGDPQATVMRLSGFAEVKPFPNLTFSVAPRLQISSDPLLSFEEFSAGNYTIGRGYDPGTLLGDDGFGYSAELRVDRWQPDGETPLVLQPFVFGDAAWVWNRDVPSRVDPQRLASIGGGIRASYDDRLRLDVTLAQPLKRAGFQTERGDMRLLVSFTTRLLPWGAR